MAAAEDYKQSGKGDPKKQATLDAMVVSAGKSLQEAKKFENSWKANYGGNSNAKFVGMKSGQKLNYRSVFGDIPIEELPMPEEESFGKSMLRTASMGMLGGEKPGLTDVSKERKAFFQKYEAKAKEKLKKQFLSQSVVDGIWDDYKEFASTDHSQMVSYFGGEGDAFDSVNVKMPMMKKGKGPTVVYDYNTQPLREVKELPKEPPKTSGKRTPDRKSLGPNLGKSLEEKYRKELSAMRGEARKARKSLAGMNPKKMLAEAKKRRERNKKRIRMIATRK